MSERGRAQTGRVRAAAVFGGLLAVLIVVNLQIADKQRVVENGATVLLELAPRDPRSLLQGDYMALRYRMTDDVARAARAAGISDGLAVIGRDADGVASFRRLADDQAIAAGELLLRFRKRGETVRIASDAFFFEEGAWETYANARYGELKVGPDGDAVLTGLRDEALAPLGTPTGR